MLFELGQHGGFGRLEDAIHAAEDGERQDDLAAQKICDRQQEGGEVHGLLIVATVFHILDSAIGEASFAQ